LHYFRRSEVLSEVKSDLYSRFGESNRWSRGKKLEGILNRLFQVGGILIWEAFTLKGQDSEGIVEQIDGVVEIEEHLYLVEMKWWNKPLGRGDVSQHLVHTFSRGDARGIFISSSGYTDPAIDTCKEALQHTVIVLCKLEEVIFLLENDVDLKDFLKTKIHVAIIDKNPMFEPLREALYNDC
jgi:restriction system protein